MSDAYGVDAKERDDREFDAFVAKFPNLGSMTQGEAMRVAFTAGMMAGIRVSQEFLNDTLERAIKQGLLFR